MFDYEKLSVSNKHVWLRVLCFALAVVLAMAAFSYGLTSMGLKEPGYYEIQAPKSEDASLYANGFTLIYYFEGESSDIKQQHNALQELYSSVLMRSYKLLDSENTYEGFVNLASLNQTPGQILCVSQELLSVLKDAQEKSEAGSGFHLFSGALHEEWESILTLDDISEFVPGNNSDMALRIQTLAEKTGDPSLVTFEILDEAQGKVRLNVDSGYLAFLEEQEYSCNLLSLSTLKDAYRMDMIVDALVEQGYGNGYLYTDSGLTVNLPDHDGGAYAVYGTTQGMPEVCATVVSAPGSAFGTIRTYPMEGNTFRYHVLDDQYYHPYFRVEDGTMPQVLESVSTLSSQGDIVRCCYENLRLLSQSSQEAALSAAGTYGVQILRFREDPAMYTNDIAVVQAAQENIEMLLLH